MTVPLSSLIDFSEKTLKNADPCHPVAIHEASCWRKKGGFSSYSGSRCRLLSVILCVGNGGGVEEAGRGAIKDMVAHVHERESP